jgi:hypothetical protein
VKQNVVAGASLVLEHFANCITNSGVSKFSDSGLLGAKPKFAEDFINVVFCSRHHFEQSVTISP